MRTVFDSSTRDELSARVNALSENSQALWGKMNVYQMLQHCSKGDDMMLGKIPVKPVFPARLIGKLILKAVLKNDTPLRRNSPTARELLSKENAGDLALLKAAYIKNLDEYEHFNSPGFTHPFFGAMTKEQIGQFAYKHHDHHLRQFGV